MSLEKWVEYGWLRREPTSTGEIKDLLGIVDRSLADSKVEAVSTDLRFIAAFNAALCIATTALRASGLRTVTQAGHHVKTIEWWVTFARYRLFGKVTFLIAFRSPSDLKADLAGKAKCKSLPTHTHTLSQTVAVS